MLDIDLIVWDVDGTLYDHRAMKRWLLATSLRHPFSAAAELVPVRRYHWALEERRRRGGILGSTLARFDRDHLLRVEQRWCVPAIAAVGPRPGVTRVLTAFGRRGLRQVVLSDYRSGYKLAVLGLAAYFVSTYAGEDLGFIKPRPEGLLRIAANFGVPPGRILLIGDGVQTDGAAAAAAGCRCLIVGHDFRNFEEFASGDCCGVSR